MHVTRTSSDPGRRSTCAPANTRNRPRVTVAERLGECGLCFERLAGEECAALVGGKEQKRICTHLFHNKCIGQAPAGGRCGRCVLCNEVYSGLRVIPPITEPVAWFKIMDVGQTGCLSKDEFYHGVLATFNIEPLPTKRQLDVVWDARGFSENGGATCKEILGRYGLIWMFQRTGERNAEAKHQVASAVSQLHHVRMNCPKFASDMAGWFCHWDSSETGTLEREEVARGLVRTFRVQEQMEGYAKLLRVRAGLEEAWLEANTSEEGLVSLAEFCRPGGLGDLLLRKFGTGLRPIKHPEAICSPRVVRFGGATVTTTEMEGDASSDPVRNVESDALSVLRLQTKAERQAECAICFDPLSGSRLAVPANTHGRRKCIHMFHAECLRECPKEYGCPLCRASYKNALEVPLLKNQPGEWFKIMDIDRNGLLDSNEFVHAIVAEFPINRNKVERLLPTLLKKHGTSMGKGLTFQQLFGPKGAWWRFHEDCSVLANVVRQANDVEFGRMQKIDCPDIRINKASWFKFWDAEGTQVLSKEDLVRAFVKSFDSSGKSYERRIRIRSVVADAWPKIVKENVDAVTLVQFVRPNGLGDRILENLSITDKPVYKKFWDDHSMTDVVADVEAESPRLTSRHAWGFSPLSSPRPGLDSAAPSQERRRLNYSPSPRSGS